MKRQAGVGELLRHGLQLGGSPLINYQYLRASLSIAHDDHQWFTPESRSEVSSSMQIETCVLKKALGTWEAS